MPTLVLVAALSFSFAIPVAAQDRPGANVTISGEREDTVFAAGGRVAIDAKIDDDVIAAGGTVRLTNTSANHAIVAGGTVEIVGGTVDDAILGGGTVTLSGEITDDVIAAGGTVTIAKEAVVRDSVSIVGGNVIVDGAILGKARLRGGTVTVNGTISGATDIAAGEFTLGDSARLLGPLNYRAREAKLSEKASIAGPVERKEFPDMDGRIPRQGEGGGVGGFVIGAIALVVLAVMLRLVFPNFADGASRRFAEGWRTAGFGVLALIGIPIAIVIAFVLIVGWPIALLLLFVYLALFPLAVATSAVWLGQRLARALSRENSWAMTAAGALTLAILFAIPILGGIAFIAALLLGMGAILAWIWSGRSAATFEGVPG
jgi:hypothetical protein